MNVLISPVMPKATQKLWESIGAGGVLVTGSVVTVGEARVLLKRPQR